MRKYSYLISPSTIRKYSYRICLRGAALLLLFYTVSTTYVLINKTSQDSALRDGKVFERLAKQQFLGLGKEPRGEINPPLPPPRFYVGVTTDSNTDKLGPLVSHQILLWDGPPHSTIEIKREEKKPDRVPIFFINLDRSTDRRQSFEKDFDALPENLSAGLQLQRISAVTTTEVQSMLDNGSFILNGVKELTFSQRELGNIGQYTFNEAACTLSHLKAIRQAYNDGHDMVMVFEDDAALTTEFLENWRAFANQAPTDWQILQWTTINEAPNRRQLYRSNDFWVAWKPYHWSTMAYTIRREGMKRILDSTLKRGSSSDKTAIDRWEFDEPDVFVADELIYYSARNTYTSTFPWIDHKKLPTTMGMYHHERSDLTFGRSAVEIPVINEGEKRHEKIAVIVTCLLKNEEDVVEEIQRLNADIVALSKFHLHSRWFINVVLVHDELKHFFTDRMSILPFNEIEINVRIEVNPKRFNKFIFVPDVLDKVVASDEYVLLKDNDIRLAGFEWNTFMNVMDDSIIAAPFRETPEELLYRARFDSTGRDRLVNFQNGALLNGYDNDSYKTARKIPTMFLEMSFVLMRVDFAAWFFGQILTEEFLGQDVDWGPDLMWCGAAHAFNAMHGPKSSSPCSIVSVNILDNDTKQIEKGSLNSGFYKQGHAVVDRFQSNTVFSSWMNASLSLSPGTVRLGGLTGWCKRRNFHHIGKCGIARAESTVSATEASIVSNTQDGSKSEGRHRRSNIFHVKELVQGKENVALYRKTSQSSTIVHKLNFGAALSAVDGNTDPDFKIGSVSATNDGECNPWWMVNLDRTYSIHSVELHNRMDCCSERLANFTVELLSWSNTSWVTAAQVDVYGEIGARGLILFSEGSRGSAVRVKLHSCDPLSLAEVMVYSNREMKADFSKDTPPELTTAPVVKDGIDRDNITFAITTTAVAFSPAAETAGQEKDSPGNLIVKEADATIQAKAEILLNLNIRYYMYDHPNITLSNTRFPRIRILKKWARYHHEGSNDAQMLAALEQSPLRTLTPEDAELYIPPIPMMNIFASRNSSNLFDLAFDTLVNHELFRQHQGNKHILISTPYILYRSDKMRHVFPMKKWHPLIYNMTPVLSWDPNAIYNAVKEGFDFKDFDFQRLETLSRRSFSVGLGDAVSSIGLQLASLEKFQKSSNLIFYQSRTELFFNNSTIFRHAPITNITHAEFPKSCIGFGLKDPDEWLREFQDSKFCLVIRGDSPHSHSLWRAIRLGCIPVIAADSLPIYAPMFKSTLNMSEYAVLVSEEELVTDTEKTLLKLQDMSDAEVEAKVKHLAFAQRVIMTDHPQSLFVPAFLYEATMASEVAFV